MEEINCRVCGFNHESPIWGENNIEPTYEICDCCGCEFGNDDYTNESILRYRNAWLIDGAKWFTESKKPIDWNLLNQLKSILDKYKR